MANITNRTDFTTYCPKNKYTKWYFSIIDKALVRGWSKKNSPQYVESHHIIPKSIVPNNNTVLLTAKEHFICHLLLPRMMKDVVYKNKMLYALWHISHHMSGLRNLKINSRTYNKIKQNYKQMVSEKYKGTKGSAYGKYGKEHPAYGYKHTEEHKKYISECLKGKNNPMFGKKHPEEIIKKKSKQYYFVYNNKKIEVFNLRKFCRDNLLDQGAMTRVNSGKQINHKGYSKWLT